jgi:GWxTD domain-containing protein
MPTFVLSAVMAASPLSEKHRLWLEEEVVYIITTREKEVFLEMPSDEARDRFIATFWEARDPTPGTSRNEFRDEHNERLREAKRLFRGFGPPGHKSQRGRIYVQLGSPRERRTYDHVGQLWPVELWFYNVEHPKLPPFFYLLFYRKAGAGDYRLWDPITDGPTALFATENLNPARRRRGYKCQMDERG